MEERLDELARKLAAAYGSYFIGLKSTDYTLKNYIGDRPIGDYWYHLAAKIERECLDPLPRKLDGVPVRRPSEN
jgi:hypothetical protein